MLSVEVRLLIISVYENKGWMMQNGGGIFSISKGCTDPSKNTKFTNSCWGFGLTGID